MPNYEVEVIFEPTGHFMNFTYEAESDNETDLCNEVLNQLSIVRYKLNPKNTFDEKNLPNQI